MLTTYFSAFKVKSVYPMNLSRYNRTAEYPELEETRSLIESTPISSQDHTKIRLFLRAFSKHSLNSDTWCPDHCPGKLVPGSNHSPVKNHFLATKPTSPMQLHAIPLDSVVVNREQRSHYSLLPSWGAVGHHKVYPQYPLLWAEQTKGPLSHI